MDSDHDMIVRMEAKLDMILEWIQGHRTEHMRTRLAVGGALLSGLIAIITRLL